MNKTGHDHMKVILPVSHIPIGSTVTKITGQKVYILQDSMVIHSDPPQTFKAPGRSRFLFCKENDGGSNHINVVDPEIEFWHVELDTLEEFIQQEREE